MRRFPAEFADLLTAKGRRILDRGAARDDPLIYLSGMIAPATALAAHALLERALRPHLAPMERAIPPESITRQTRNHQERLIKTVRNRTAYLESRRSRAWAAAERIGLIRLLRSESLRRFAERISGTTLDPKNGQQAIRYGPGDYAGPHTDHHPEEPRAAGGYLDVHISLGHPDVQHQYLVWAEAGHFMRIVDVSRPGGLALYRLPLWHYTTPLVARRKAGAASRWVLLATYLYAQDR
jgi:hypothetical protein